jgi:hypothetical protein
MTERAIAPKPTSHHQSIICPYCGHEHGDAREWCCHDFPQDLTCAQCQEVFECWAEVDVTYCSRPKRAEPKSEAQRNPKLLRQRPRGKSKT